MNLVGLSHKVSKFAVRNSSAICSGLAIAGVLTTGYFAWKAGKRHHQVMCSQDPYMPWQDQLKQTWRLYIPAAVAAVGTIGFIIASQRISDRRNAALAAAYSLTERAFTEYKDKVVETIGEKKEADVREEIVKDRVTANPPSGEFVVLGTGEVTCYETFTGRYFKSNPEHIKQAQNKINAEILNNFGYVSANDFWEAINLPWVQSGDEVGWNTDTLLEVQLTSHLDPNSRPCLAVGYSDLPVAKYHYHG